MNKRLVIASTSVSKFSSAVSRVRRISFGEKRLKMSSVDSGSSQNWRAVECQYGGDGGGKAGYQVSYRCPVWIIGGDDFVL